MTQRPNFAQLPQVLNCMSNGPPPRRQRPPQPFTPEPTLRDVSNQIVGLSGQVTDVFLKVKKVDERAERIEDRVDVLYEYILTDHAPRVTAIEKRTGSIRTVAACGAKYTAIATGVVGLALQVASAFRPDLVSPLQTLMNLLGGM